MYPGVLASLESISSMHTDDHCQGSKYDGLLRATVCVTVACRVENDPSKQ